MSVLTFDAVFGAHKTKFTSVKLNETEIHHCVSYMTKIFKMDQKLKGKALINKSKYRDMFELSCAITAISRVVNFQFMDYDDIKKSPMTQFRDFVGQYFDVILFEHGKFPTFYYKMYKKAIFVCKMNETEYVVCGFGTPYVINSFHSKSLIINQTIREQSAMSAFYGFEHLKKLPKNIYDFKLLIK